MDGVPVSGEGLSLLASESPWACFRRREVWLGLGDCLLPDCVEAPGVLATLRTDLAHSWQRWAAHQTAVGTEWQVPHLWLAPGQSGVSAFRDHWLSADLGAGN